MNNVFKMQGAVTAYPKRKLGLLIRPARQNQKKRYAKFLWGKQSYVNTDAIGPPHARTHTHTHTRARAHAHTHAH
jgi:hypothetical protein